jgi:hypothetical protein
MAKKESRHGHIFQGFVGLNRSEIQPLQKKPQFPATDLHHLFAALRPLEPMLFQPFLPKAESVAVPIQYLDHGATPIAEDKKMPRKRVKLQCTFHQQ